MSPSRRTRPISRVAVTTYSESGLMRNAKAIAAILAALVLGMVAATLITGCQPAKPRGSSVGTTSTTTDAGPQITIPKGEIKDEKPGEASAAEPKPVDKPVLPAGEKPTDG